MKNSVKAIGLTTLVCVSVLMTACKERVVEYPYKSRLDDALIFLKEKHDPDSAIVILDSLLKEYPDNQDCRFVRAKAYWYMDRNQEALTEIDGVIQHINKNSLTYESTIHRLKSFILTELGDLDGAIDECAKAVRLAIHDNPDCLQNLRFQLAQLLYNADRMDESDNVYREMLSDDSEDASAMLGLARNCLERGYIDTGLEWANKAAIASSYYADVYRIRMQLFYKQGMMRQAADDAFRYVEMSDTDEVDLRAVTRIASGSYEYSIDKINQKIEELEECGVWLVLLVRMYEYNGFYDKALDTYLQMLEVEPDNGILHGLLANCYSLMGWNDDAIREINTAIELTPDPELTGRRGDIYINAGEYRKAIADFSSLAESGWATPDVYRYIGLCYERMGQCDLAFEYYKRGISLFPEQDAGLYVLSGFCYLENGNKRAAEDNFITTLEIEEKTGETKWTPYALLGLGSWDKAIESIDSIIKEYPQDVYSYFDRTCLLCRMGRTNEALVSLRETLQHGFRSFATIENDTNLAPLRGNPEYRLLMAEYKGRN